MPTILQAGQWHSQLMHQRLFSSKARLYQGHHPECFRIQTDDIRLKGWVSDLRAGAVRNCRLYPKAFKFKFKFNHHTLTRGLAKQSIFMA